MSQQLQIDGSRLRFFSILLFGFRIFAAATLCQVEVKIKPSNCAIKKQQNNRIEKGHSGLLTEMSVFSALFLRVLQLLVCLTMSASAYDVQLCMRAGICALQ